MSIWLGSSYDAPDLLTRLVTEVVGLRSCDAEGRLAAWGRWAEACVIGAVGILKNTSWLNDDRVAVAYI